MRILVLVVLFMSFAGLFLAVQGVRADRTSAAPAATTPAADRLVVNQDPSVLAHTIGVYLTARKLVVTEKPNSLDPKSIFLDLPFSAGSTPAFTIYLVTQALFPDAATKQFTENGIYLTLWTGLKVDPKQRAAAMDIINNWNSTKLLGAASLGPGDEVRLGYGIKVLSDGLPTADVPDALWELVYNWQDLYPQLKPMLVAK